MNPDSLKTTMPFNDDSEMEAQLVNLASETQVLNFAGETQLLDDSDGAAEDDDAETELLDEEGVIGVESEEGSNGTQVLRRLSDPWKAMECDSHGATKKKRWLEGARW